MTNTIAIPNWLESKYHKGHNISEHESDMDLFNMLRRHANNVTIKVHDNYICIVAI